MLSNFMGRPPRGSSWTSGGLLVEPLIVWKRPWPLRSVSPKMLTLASFRPSMRLTADGRGKPHTLTYASDHLPCRSRAEGHLALHDRGFRQFDGCFIRAPQGEAWTITPDMRSANVRMDEVWLDFPELSHAREPLTDHRRYTYDVAQVSHAHLVGWYVPGRRHSSAGPGPAGSHVRRGVGTARGPGVGRGAR